MGIFYLKDQNVISFSDKLLESHFFSGKFAPPTVADLNLFEDNFVTPLEVALTFCCPDSTTIAHRVTKYKRINKKKCSSIAK